MNETIRGWLTAGEAEVGIWCEWCYLPSCLRVPITLITENGVTPEAAVVVMCQQCERRTVGRPGCRT